MGNGQRRDPPRRPFAGSGNLRAMLLYRIASVVFVLFAVGHTLGFMKFTAPTAEGRAVRQSMDDVKMQVQGATYTYRAFYEGSGLTITVYLLFFAALAWHLGMLAKTSPRAIGMLGGVFVVVQLVTLGLSLKYFGPPPAIFRGC
jgi:hypothetical protein